MKIERLPKSDYKNAESLLIANNLPYSDIYSANIKLFELTEHGESIAIGGFESYGKTALLRSMAVIPGKQLKGTGSFLLNNIENIAIDNGIEEFYLLTNTAPEFFKKRAYVEIERDLFPKEIQKSMEFESLCPHSAFGMMKNLKNKYVPLQLKVNEDILLKQIELSDAHDIYNTINSQRSYLGEWLPFVAHTHTINNTSNFIQATLDCPKDEREFVFTIQHQNEFAGIIGFRDTDKGNKKTEIGYWLNKNKQGKGIIITSLKRLIDYTFSELELNRIQIKCAVSNLKSNKIPQQLNFELEGIERDGEIFPDGSYKDLEVYSLLKTDFQNR